MSWQLGTPNFWNNMDLGTWQDGTFGTSGRASANHSSQTPADATESTGAKDRKRGGGWPLLGHFFSGASCWHVKVSI